MASIWKHGCENDWCHICGFRRDSTADIFYPANAEHDKANTKYIRICSGCAFSILDAIQENLEIETTPWHKSSRGHEKLQH